MSVEFNIFENEFILELGLNYFTLLGFISFSDLRNPYILSTKMLSLFESLELFFVWFSLNTMLLFLNISLVIVYFLIVSVLKLVVLSSIMYLI